MSVLNLIIKREFIAKVRNKSFIVMTFVSPLIFVGIAFLIGYLSNMRSEIKHIGVHDESGYFIDSFKNTSSYQYEDVSHITKSEIKDSLLSKRWEGVLYIPKLDNFKDFEKNVEYISEDSPSLGFVSQAERVLSDKLTKENWSAQGIDTLKIEAARIDVDLNLVKSSGEETVRGLNEIKIAIGSGFGYMIMMFIVIYGNMVMRSVIEEKTSRIIEIIISSVKPFHLMMGKIIGTTLAGLLQFAIWAIVGGILFILAQSFFGLNTSSLQQANEMTQQSPDSMAMIKMYIEEIKSLPLLSMLIYFIVYFIGGYFLYSSIYAAIGAAVDNETDTQQFMFPVIMPLMLAVYVGFFTVIHEPHGTIATAFSLIPFTSPIVMLMRIPFGVPAYQIILSIVLLLGTFVGMVWVASKIYRIGILSYGKKPSWKELLKWLKY